MTTFTTKPGPPDEYGPVFHVYKTVDGVKRVFATCNKEEDAKEVADTFNKKYNPPLRQVRTQLSPTAQ